jgi:adenylate cyclase
MDSGQKPLKTEALFDIPFTPEAVWSVLSKTDWLNRSAGLPPVSYEIAPLPEGGTKVAARTHFFGLPFEWEEKPFEWREPEFYRVERVFARGPIERIVGGIEFHKAAGNTRLRSFSEIYPRSALGKFLARFLLGPKALEGMDDIIRHVTEFLRGSETICMPRLKKTALNEEAFRAAGQRLRSMAGETNLVSRLEQFMRETSDVELARIRPFAIARQWGEDRWNVLRLFLLGTRAGLLDLSWEVLCPNCRSTREPVAHALSELKRTAHCEVCQIRFDAEFDKSVELKFTVNSAIKQCEEQTFCLAGPGAKPHVISQTVIPSNEAREVKLPEDAAGVRIRSPQVKNVVGAQELNGFSRLVGTKESFVLEKGVDRTGSIQIANPNKYPVVVFVEKVQWDEEILTAAAVTNLQEFRDLFAQQVISPTEQIVVGQQIILFTDLRGSTAMYCGIGDAPAYAVVRDHFDILRRAVQEHRGGIVKTIGDAVMAVFSDAADALQAVAKMHRQMNEVNAPPDQPALRLKSSLHIGPCLAVNANERLDYFGTTVNLAARLVDCCQGGDLTISDDLFLRSETETFLRKNQFRAEAAEMKFRGFQLPVKIWRIALVDEQTP